MRNYTNVQRANNATYYMNHEGDLHRTDGPAVEYDDGSYSYYINNVRHRIDGPAVMCISSNGKITEGYWIEGTQISKEEFVAFVNNKGTSFIPKYRF